MRRIPAALARRLISAAIILPIVVVLVLLGPWTLAGLLALIALLGGIELSSLLRRLAWRAPPSFLPVAAVASLAVALSDPVHSVLPLIAAGIAVAAVLWLARPAAPSQPDVGPGAWAVHCLGAIYLGVLLSFFARLAEGPWLGAAPEDFAARRVFYALAIVFASDTGSFAIGSRLGRRKMWPSVSPAKTWEGALGGFLAAVAAGAAFAPWLSGGLGPGGGAFVGGAASVAAQLGDLIESRLKRRAGVKDSGRLIPGHGGLLDRLDSLLFAAPVVYYATRALVEF